MTASRRQGQIGMETVVHDIDGDIVAHARRIKRAVAVLRRQKDDGKQHNGPARKSRYGLAYDAHNASP